MKILITGGDGFFGRGLLPLFEKDGYSIMSCNKNKLNLLNINNIKEILKKYSPDFIIHAAICGKGKTNESKEIFYDNILSLENLINCKEFYKGMIVFGSGAEFNRNNNIKNVLEENSCSMGVPTDSYGLSKYFQSIRIKEYDWITELIIFNCFGEYEDNNKFIKTAIINYINKKSIEIFDDKTFDFFYINDLYQIILKCISESILYRKLNCCYNEKLKISDIANKINNLSTYKVPIEIQQNTNISYTGNCEKINSLNLSFMGLDIGLQNCYHHILKMNE